MDTETALNVGYKKGIFRGKAELIYGLLEEGERLIETETDVQEFWAKLIDYMTRTTEEGK